MADSIQIQQDIQRDKNLGKDVTRNAIDRSRTKKSTAEIELEKSAKRHAEAIVGAQQQRTVRSESMVKFKQQMSIESARREEQIVGWMNYRWIDHWGDDTANRGIVLDATNSWAHAPKYGYA